MSKENKDEKDAKLDQSGTFYIMMGKSNVREIHFYEPAL